MGQLQGVKNYYYNAKLLAARGALGYEKPNVVKYYSGVVKCIDAYKQHYPNAYIIIKSAMYGNTKTMDRTEFRHLRKETNNLIQIVQKYETEHFAELVQIWNEERKSERARHSK